MIKIKKWFSDEIRESYLKCILFEINKNQSSASTNNPITENNEIEFIPGYKINIGLLLTGSKKEVTDIDGIDMYILMCRFWRYQELQ